MARLNIDCILRLLNSMGKRWNNFLKEGKHYSGKSKQNPYITSDFAYHFSLIYYIYYNTQLKIPSYFPVSKLGWCVHCYINALPAFSVRLHKATLRFSFM